MEFADMQARTGNKNPMICSLIQNSIFTCSKHQIPMQVSIELHLNLTPSPTMTKLMHRTPQTMLRTVSCFLAITFQSRASCQISMLPVKQESSSSLGQFNPWQELMKIWTLQVGQQHIWSCFQTNLHWRDQFKLGRVERSKAKHTKSGIYQIGDCRC